MSWSNGHALLGQQLLAEKNLAVEEDQLNVDVLGVVAAEHAVERTDRRVDRRVPEVVEACGPANGVDAGEQLARAAHLLDGVLAGLGARR